jgi:hypothetical protein
MNRHSTNMTLKRLGNQRPFDAIALCEAGSRAPRTEEIL